MRVRDVTCDSPRILLVGINPGRRSGEVGHHFAGNSNPFWKLLYASRLVPEPLTCFDELRLAEFDVALTNVCPRATRSAAELSRNELERGMRTLRRKIRRWRPHVVAFVGLDIYRGFFGLKQSGGAGAKKERYAGAYIFALPNPSGINANFPGFAQKLVWFKRLREFSDKIEKLHRTAQPREPKEARRTSALPR